MKMLLRVFNGSEYGSGDIDYAIVDLTPKLARTILEWRKDFLELSEGKDGVMGVAIRDEINCKFLKSIDESEHGDFDRALDNDFCEISPDFPEVKPSQVAKTECGRMQVTADGVCWSCFKENGNTEFETAYLPYNRVEEAIG